MEKHRVFVAIVTHTYISVDDFGGKLYELDKMTYTIGNFGQFCINAYLKICRNREIENDLIQAKSQKSLLCSLSGNKRKKVVRLLGPFFTSVSVSIATLSKR